MDGQAPDGLRRFIDLFNRGLFWEAHEVLEDLWRERGRDPFLQGLIQLAAAYIHVQRNHPRGVKNLLRRVEGYLAPFSPAHMGLPVDAILDHVERLRVAVGRAKASPHCPLAAVAPPLTLPLPD